MRRRERWTGAEWQHVGVVADRVLAKIAPKTTDEAA
jgi:hypothetical protein